MSTVFYPMTPKAKLCLLPYKHYTQHINKEIDHIFGILRIRTKYYLKILGPMLLFERYFESKSPRRFYSCSASRDRKECNFFQWEDEKLSTASQHAHKRIIEASKPSIGSDKIRV